MRLSQLIAVMLLLITSSGFSQEALLQKAHSAAASENYESAIEVYKGLLSEGNESSDIHFNLATAFYHNNDLPQAVLHYLKVLKKQEGHRDAKINLNIVNDQRASDLSHIPDFFLVQWWRGITGLLSSTIWSTLFFLTILVCIFFFRKWLFESHKRKRRLGVTVLSLILAIVLFFAASSKHKRETQLQYVVNMVETALYIGPDLRSGEVIQIIPGEKLKVLDTREGWIKVALINKEVGWVSESAISRV